MVSALEEEGLKAVWDEMTELVDWRKETNHFTGRRTQQARYWFEEEVRQGLLALLHSPEAQSAMQAASEAVSQGLKTPSVAAQEVLGQLQK